MTLRTVDDYTSRLFSKFPESDLVPPKVCRRVRSCISGIKLDLLRVGGGEVEDRSGVRITKVHIERELVRERSGTRHKTEVRLQSLRDTHGDCIGSSWKIVDFEDTF